VGPSLSRACQTHFRLEQRPIHSGGLRRRRQDREIRSTGFNGFPRGIEDNEERLADRAQKYPLICHAEENAIMHAARIGVSLKGCAAYVTWPPCTRCARSLIQSGVNEIIYPANCEIPDRWADDFAVSTDMIREAGLTIRLA
jgi:dCMP deaminase